MGQKNGPRTAECWRKQAATLLAKLVSVFRITAAADASGSYKDQLATKLEKLFQQSPYNATDIKLVAGATTWKEDNNLLALLGCLNLFLIHNPTHEFNALRAGSLIMHGKDCAVIPMVDYMSNLLNFHPDELLTLGVYRRLGEEILNLLEHLEGDTGPDCYSEGVSCTERLDWKNGSRCDQPSCPIHCGGYQQQGTSNA